MNKMNLENIKVREVSGPEKGTAEIEQELLDTHKLKEEQGETAEVVLEEKNTELKEELTDESVLNFLGKRYNKEINSFDELMQEKEVTPDLPEDVTAFLKFKKDTGRGIADYVSLNRDFEAMQPDNLLAEYFLATDEAIDSEDVDALLDDYTYDEDVDDEKAIKKKKLAKKRAVVKARNYFTQQKEQYKQPLESRTVENSEASKYKEEQEQRLKSAKSNEEVTKKKQDWFRQKTNEVFSNEFKGFEFELGDKKITYSPGDASELKSKQSNVLNFINKYMNQETGMIDDAKGYHRALSLAMNPEKYAKFFYEQGKSEGVDGLVRKTKNVNMNVRRTPEVSTQKGGMKVRALNSDSGSGLRIKSTRKIN
tara:strand:- start:908 stop:2008 length:1101 start_codon:yes stop_codon:yes gene_type:complete